MDVSIVIVNYNTCQVTLDCIDSICRETSGVDYEIIVVDNNSTDGSRERLGEDKRITYLYQDKNLGFGKANNIGVSHARGKYIFFLNSDTYLTGNAVKQLYDFAETNEEKGLGAIGCKLKDPDGEYTHSYGKFHTFKSQIGPRLIMHFNKKKGIALAGMDYKGKDFPGEFEVDYVTGADIFVRRAVLERCGGFDPDFFMYYEEAEMQHRFRMRGYRNMIMDCNDIVHLEGKSQVKVRKKRSIKRELMILRSKFLYMKKAYNPMAYFAFRCLYALVDLPYPLLSRNLTLKERKDYIKALLTAK